MTESDERPSQTAPHAREAIGRRRASPPPLSIARIEAGWFGRPRAEGWRARALDRLSRALTAVERSFIKPTRAKGDRHPD